MPPWNLPNSLIYLHALFRPRSLRPDAFVPSISHVDWPAIRQLGYNGVVVDKDNCLTWPEKDELHPSISAGWKSLRETFGSRRILVVSNSAGTRKDPGGIAAESVSRRLHVPVLLHAQAKPGCASQIIDYFEGRVGINRTSPAEVEEIPEMLLQTEEEKTFLSGSSKEMDENDELRQRRVAIHSPPNPQPLRLLIIGDRLATDVLLARRLGRHFPPTSTDEVPRMLSIITTQLFKPSDVRVLRWLESKWSIVGGGSSTEPGRIDWGRYVFDRSLDAVIPHETASPSNVRRSGLVGRWDDLKSRARNFCTVNTARRIAMASMAMIMKGFKRLGSETMAALRRLLQRTRGRGLQVQERSAQVVTTKST